MKYRGPATRGAPHSLLNTHERGEDMRKFPLGTLFLAVGLFILPATTRAQETSDGFVVDGIAVVGGELEGLDGLFGTLFTLMIESSEYRSLIEVRDLDDDTYADDEEISIALYAGIDQDGDPENDFDGDQSFDVDAEALDADGEPRVLITPGSIEDSLFSAGPVELDLSDLGIEIDADVDLETRRGTVTWPW